ncbi:hypothetical protein ACFPRL_16390 [Pseudoclavibacter helvolus]
MAISNGNWNGRQGEPPPSRINTGPLQAVSRETQQLSDCPGAICFLTIPRCTPSLARALRTRHRASTPSSPVYPRATGHKPFTTHQAPGTDTDTSHGHESRVTSHERHQ